MKTFITSFNTTLYDEYGRRFLESWRDFAAGDVKLIVCHEGDISEEESRFVSDNLKIVPIESPAQTRFFRNFKRFYQANGIVFKNHVDDKNLLAYGYNFRFDAIRFSFKAFAYLKAFELNLINTDFAWIDADVVCLKSFCSSDLNDLFPEDIHIASYLGRDHYPKPNPYSECGFVGYNFKHPQCISFFKEFLKLYEQGDIFSLKEWHDCMAFDHVRLRFEKQGYKFKNLAIGAKFEDHPFKASALGRFFDHLKGPSRKKQGYS